MRHRAECPMQLRTESFGDRCILLVVALAALWILTIAPAYPFFAVGGIKAATVSAVCCLLAGCLTFWLAARVSQPRNQAYIVLLGTAIRAIFALIGALVMQFLLGLSVANYLVWLGLFYLV